MSTFYKIFGAGLPTTCQYFHVYRDKKDSLEYKVSSYFMLNGLGIAQQLYDGCSITFLGYAFAHCTSLCYIVNIDNNTYIFRNDNNIFCLLAWGRSGGHKEYKKYHSNTQTYTLTLTLTVILRCNVCKHTCWCYRIRIFVPWDQLVKRRQEYVVCDSHSMELFVEYD